MARLEQLAADGARPLDEPLVDPPDPDEPLPDVRSTMSGGRYEAAVEAAREHILAGDIFQVVLAQRFDLDLDADPFDVYRVLRQVNPSPYMYFVRHPEVTLVGSSPEPMVQLLDGRVISRPIAGTRYRGRTEEEDRRLGGRAAASTRRSSPSTSMLVDLARNDVGRVVRFGTEKVDEMMTLERYSHVMHLTSQVSGDLAEGRTPIDVLRATLPAGTVSGAPKVRAMEIIDELEPTKRGPVRRRGRLPRLLRQHRHRHRHPHDGRAGPTAPRRCRPARASWPTRSPRTRTSSAATRPGRCSPPSPPPAA